MIAGLRTLILKAALLSPQFTSRDVQVFKLDCLTYVHCTCLYMLLDSCSYYAIPPSESNDSLFAHLAYLAVEHQPVVGLDQPPTHRHQPPGPAPSSPRQHLEEQRGDEEVLHRPAEDACQEPRRRRHQ